MGLCNSPDIFQEKMNKLFTDLEYNKAYIDDHIKISNECFQYHINKLDKVLSTLKLKGFKVNAEKYQFI